MAIETKEIKINDLILWDENARFPDKYFNSDEKELIKYFVSKPEYRIKTLLEEVIHDFDLPQLEKLVVWDDEGSYVTLEGNRRLTVYKLLVNPLLIDDENLQSFIVDLKLNTDISENLKLECLVSNDKDTLLKYIDRKHNKGNNEVNWQEPERLNFSSRGGTSSNTNAIKLGVTSIIRNSDLDESIKEKILGKGYVTNFFRIIAGTPAKKKYKYHISEDGLFSYDYDENDFISELKTIIYSLIKKEDLEGNKLDSRTLNKQEQIESFINSITPEDSKKIETKIEKSTTENLFGDKTIQLSNSNNKPKVLPKSTTRGYLIPKTCCLCINEAKINNIYRELRDDLLLDDSNKSVPNAVGVLFRVFLEVSLDFYAKKNQWIFKKEDTLSIKIPWVVENLKNKGYDSKIFNNINKVGSAKKENTYLSIDNFHEYVHSHTTQPSSNELKLKWDNLQEFFETLWNDLNKKKK